MIFFFCVKNLNDNESIQLAKATIANSNTMNQQESQAHAAK